MPNVKGQPRVGGRAPGTINKRSQEFIDQLNRLQKKHKWNLVDAMFDTAMGKDKILNNLEPDDKAAHAMRARTWLGDHAIPKLKAVEHTGEIELPVRGFRLAIVRDGPDGGDRTVTLTPVDPLT